MEAWREHLVAVRGLSQGTVDRYVFLVRRALVDCGGSVSPHTLEAHLKRLYLAKAGVSVRQGVVVALRSFCEFLGTDAAARLRSPKGYKRGKPSLTVEEVEGLIWDRGRRLPDGLQLRNRALLAVLYGGALRVTEARFLRADEVSWNGRLKLFFLPVRGKGAGEEARVALDRHTSRVLGAYLAEHPGEGWLFPSLRGTPLSRPMITKIFRQRVQEAGIKSKGRRLSPHILRHSIANHLLQVGVDIKTVSVHLRHSSVATTDIYTYSDASRVARALVRKSPLERGRRALRESGVPLLERFGAELAALADQE